MFLMTSAIMCREKKLPPLLSLARPKKGNKNNLSDQWRGTVWACDLTLSLHLFISWPVTGHSEEPQWAFSANKEQINVPSVVELKEVGEKEGCNQNCTECWEKQSKSRWHETQTSPVCHSTLHVCHAIHFSLTLSSSVAYLLDSFLITWRACHPRCITVQEQSVCCLGSRVELQICLSHKNTQGTIRLLTLSLSKLEGCFWAIQGEIMGILAHNHWHVWPMNLYTCRIFKYYFAINVCVTWMCFYS